MRITKSDILKIWILAAVIRKKKKTALMLFEEKNEQNCTIRDYIYLINIFDGKNKERKENKQLRQAKNTISSSCP